MKEQPGPRASPHCRAALRTARALEAVRAANYASAADMRDLAAIAAGNLSEQGLAGALYAALRQIERKDTSD